MRYLDILLLLLQHFPAIILNLVLPKGGPDKEVVEAVEGAAEVQEEAVEHCISQLRQVYLQLSISQVLLRHIKQTISLE